MRNSRLCTICSGSVDTSFSSRLVRSVVEWVCSSIAAITEGDEKVARDPVELEDVDVPTLLLELDDDDPSEKSASPCDGAEMEVSSADGCNWPPSKPRTFERNPHSSLTFSDMLALRLSLDTAARRYSVERQFSMRVTKWLIKIA